MYVAFASRDGICIDSHFASARQFVVYNVDTKAISLREVVCFGLQEEKGEAKHDGHREDDDKVLKRMKALIECSIIYCTHIGGPAAARLVQNGIHPLKVSCGTNINEQLMRLQNMLKNNPPPWLRKKEGIK